MDISQNGNDSTNWLDNFPKEYQSRIVAHNLSQKYIRDSHKRANRYRELFDEKTEEPTPSEKTYPEERNTNLNLISANRIYTNQKLADRRNSEKPTDYPQEKCRRSKRVLSSGGSIAHFSPLREHYVDDAFEKRKRIFEANAVIPPKEIEGLEYSVLIGDDFMFIGCIERSIEQWRHISDRDILAMDGRNGLNFWQKHRDMLLTECDKHQEKIRLLKNS